MVLWADVFIGTTSLVNALGWPWLSLGSLPLILPITTCTESYCFSFQHILPNTCLCPILLSAVLGNYPIKKFFFKILIVFLCPKSIWSKKKTFSFTEVWILGTRTNQTHSFDLPHTCLWEWWVVGGPGGSKWVLVPQGRNKSEKFLTDSAKGTENQRVIIKSVFLGHHKFKHQAHQAQGSRIRIEESVLKPRADSLA